jgi:hypothetical protein
MTRKKGITAGGFAIAAEEDEVLFREYTQRRDAVRSTMGGGVYPNLQMALRAYIALDAALTKGGSLDDEDLRAYHEKLMGPIAPYVEEIRKMATGICEIMQAIEAASPGTFGISTPQEEKP